jgi:hypothetical protein
VSLTINFRADVNLKRNKCVRAADGFYGGLKAARLKRYNLRSRHTLIGRPATLDRLDTPS